MAIKKYLDDNGLTYLWSKIKTALTGKADKSNTYTKSEVDGMISQAGEENVIETVKVNGSALTPDASKAVNVTVPTKTSELTNDSDFQTSTQVASAISSAVSSVYKYKGSVANYAALEAVSTKSNGDVYNVEDTGMNYAWVASDNKWDALGITIDLSDYQKASELIAITNTEIDTIVAS